MILWPDLTEEEWLAEAAKLRRERGVAKAHPGWPVAKLDPPNVIYPGAGVDVPRRTNPPLSAAGRRRQEEAASTYRRALEGGDTDALARIFRDRRGDRLIQRLIAGEATLDAGQIDRLVRHYERRYGRHLANVEDITAQRIAARDRLRSVWERLVNRPDVDRTRVTKTWITAQDERVRDAHAAMDGMTIPFDALFPAPDTGDIWGPPAAFNCRCFVRFNYEAVPVEAALGEESVWPMPSGEEPFFAPASEAAAEEVGAELLLQQIELLAEELGRRQGEVATADEAATATLRERVEATMDTVLRFARSKDPTLAVELPVELRDLPARLLRQWVKLFERLALASGDPEWATVAATAALLAQRPLP